MNGRLATLVVLLVIVGSSASAAVAPALSALEPASTADGDGCEFPVASTDATGTEVTVEQRPGRVVTLNPSAAQTMWDIGGRSQVVGVSQFADYLTGAEERPVVTSGNPATPRVERIVDLEPDLVLAPNTISNDSVRTLRDAGLTVYRFEAATSVEDVYEKTLLTGELTGNCAAAEETVTSIRERISSVRDAVADRDRPSVYYPIGGGYTAGTGTFVHDVIRTAGGHNIAADANVSFYGIISDEVVVQEDPTYLVVASTNDSVDDPRSVVPEGEAIRETTAWEEGNVVVLDTNYLNQPGPRIVQPITTLARALHPDAFEGTTAPPTTDDGVADGSGTDGPAETVGTAGTTGLTGTELTTTAEGTDIDDGETGAATPGFGFAAFVIALLAALLAVRR